MAATLSQMTMYNLTLQRPSAITHAVFGNFSEPKAQEILVARGHMLELLRPDADTGKIQSVLSHEVFGVIRSLVPFRLVGANLDYIVVGSDSGKIIILQYDKATNKFVKVHEETFGKTGCRRVVPGQFLAVDPKGRAVMVGAAEKQKFVYILNRDSAAKLTISSPLEAHKSHTLVLDTCGVDVGFDNPIFACLEVDYDADVEEDSDEADSKEVKLPPKMLTFYELDLGLNHVTRKWSEEVDPSANMLISVPGGADGPGGVLVCSENFIVYKNQDQPEVRCPIPRRAGMDERKGLLIVSHTYHRTKNIFFFLVQTEHGDIFKVSLDVGEVAAQDGAAAAEEAVRDVRMLYFDTVPPTVSMCILKTGFLFCASEFGNHYLFQIAGVGQDGDVEASSQSSMEDYTYFTPRSVRNLELIDEMESLSPITDMKVADLTRELTPQIYTLCGRGARSTLRILRHGLAVTLRARTELPGAPTAVWALKSNINDPFCSHIVIGFSNATLVLAVGDTVSEVRDTGILNDTPSLSMSTLADDSFLQIHPNGIRRIRGDQRLEWKPPGKKTILRAAVNNRQVVVALSGGELVYFEVDKSNILSEVMRKEMGNDIAALSIAPVPPGRRKSLYMAVGGFDNTIRILSLDAAEPLRQVTLQALPAQPKSVLLASLSGSGSGSGADGGGAAGSSERLFLYVGLQNGVMIRSMVDEADGSLTDTRKKFLGTRAVRLFEVRVNGLPAVLSLSSRAWLAYVHQGRSVLAPLSYEELESATPFFSEQCPEGLVCVTGSYLLILTLERLGEMFNQQVLPLRYTPRKMVVHPVTNNLIIIESDQNMFTYAQRRQLLSATYDPENPDEAAMDVDGNGVKSEAAGAAAAAKAKAENGDSKMETDEEPASEEQKQREQDAQEAFLGLPRAGPGRWASCIRVLDPSTGDTLALHELDDNEAAFSVCLVDFSPQEDLYLCVGTAKDLQLVPRSVTAGFIHVYKLVPVPGSKQLQLQLQHKTKVEDVPLALAAYQHKLLAGVGRFLRLYETGKRMLLKKCENKHFPTSIQAIHVKGERIYVADLCEGLSFVKYRKNEKLFSIFADSLHPRYVTASCPVDYDTVACADKFGNFWLSRLPADSQEDTPDDALGNKWGLTWYNGAPNKLQDVINYHVGDMVTSIQKTSLVQGGSEVLFYSTLMGALGIMSPFSSREDMDFFTYLEMHLRQENPPILGRDHLSYRSYYFPVKDTVDGDMCEQFNTASFESQKTIANELVSTPADVSRKLEEQRNKIL